MTPAVNGQKRWPKDPLGTSRFLCPHLWALQGWGVSIPWRDPLSPEHTERTPLNYSTWPLPGQAGISGPIWAGLTPIRSKRLGCWFTAGRGEDTCGTR